MHGGGGQFLRGGLRRFFIEKEALSEGKVDLFSIPTCPNSVNGKLLDCRAFVNEKSI